MGFSLFHPQLTRRLFLAALRNLRVGELTLITPEKETWHFVGREAGPVADIILHDWGVVRRLFFGGDRAFMKDYLKENWDTETMAPLLTLLAKHEDRFQHTRLLRWRRRHVGKRKSLRPVEIMNADFCQLILDHSMSFSCALYEGRHRTLEEAQEAKHNRILERIDPPPARVLDIGCGWGGFMDIATRRGYRVRGLALSHAQENFVSTRFEGAEVAFQDYREESEIFDAIVSIEMFETIGEHFWPIYFFSVKRLLKKGGKAMIQTVITADDLFPNGTLPTRGHFLAEAEKAGLKVVSVYRFGQDYVRTLQHWLENLETQRALLFDLGYTESCLRGWRFFFGHCISNFLTRRTDVMQVELEH